MHRSARPHVGFSLVELAAAIGLTVALLALLVPALSSARAIAHRDQCAAHLTQIGGALQQYLDTNDGEFPHVAVSPAWHWGGIRYSPASDETFLDTSRPLSLALSPFSVRGEITHTFCCPADSGIGGETAHMGTGHRTVCRAFGTSYRANAGLFDARLLGMTDVARGIRRSEIVVSPSRLLVLGDPVWYEVYESTGRSADWHSLAVQSNEYSPAKNAGEIGNVLFLDGSVRFQAVRPRGEIGPIALEPTPGGGH